MSCNILQGLLNWRRKNNIKSVFYEVIKITVKEFNKCFYPQYNKALEFVRCFKHALEKCDDNTRMQMKCIGWDDDTKEFLIDALHRIENAARDSYRWSQSEWWKE